MCYTTTCPACGKTGWQGCGQHVDEVMRDVPDSQRCTCQSRQPSGKPRPAGRDQRP